MANEEKKARNIDLALKTAAELFLEQGIENTTREMIAKRSGLSRKSLERYFAVKNDCVVRTGEWMGGQLRTQLRSGPEELYDGGGYSALQLLELFLEDIKQLFLKEPRIFICYMETKTFIYRNSPDGKRDYERVLNAFGWQLLLQRIFKLGEQDGTVVAHTGPGPESNYIFDLIMSFFTSMALLHQESPERMEEYIQRYIGNVLLGHRGRSGTAEGAPKDQEAGGI
jgi:AcrR family transcriptional regulator